MLSKPHIKARYLRGHVGVAWSARWFLLILDGFGIGWNMVRQLRTEYAGVLNEQPITWDCPFMTSLPL